MNRKLLLVLWFVLFAVLIILLNRLFEMPSKKMYMLNSKISGIETIFSKISAIHSNFLYEFNKYDDLFTDNTSEQEEEARLLFGKLKPELKFLTNVPFLQKSMDFQSAIGNLIEKTDSVEKGLNDLILANKELGNQNSGLLSQWRELSLKMSNAFVFPDENTRDQISQIRQIESEFMITRDPRLLRDVSVLAEEIRIRLMPEEGGIGLNDMDDYLSLTGSLMALNQRIGSETGEGIAAGLAKAIQGVNSAIVETKVTVSTLGNNYLRIRNFIRYAVLVILTGIFIYMIIYTSRQWFLRPLEQLSETTSKLASGELPENLQLTSDLPEVKSIKKNLQDHISSLSEKVQFTMAINHGDLNKTLRIAGSNDLLGNELMELRGKLQETSERQIRNEEDNKIRRYSNEGMARFSEILRNSGSDITSLGDIFIREMVKYLDAIQGGLFILNDSNKQSQVLDLISAFAYDRKKYLQKSVAYGEGLIGTCAREKQMINLTEIPQGYISITSGLGDTLPDNLLLIPVMHEETLIGVIEIASLNRFRDYEMKLTQDVAKNLGSTIVYARNNQQTSKLLAKSQQQAQEMAEQEEEMRQNMEELKATQEESQRREEELKGFSDAVSGSFAIVEYDLNGVITNVNNKLCELVNKSREDITGKAHQDVFGSDPDSDGVFWNDLKKNLTKTTTKTWIVGETKIKVTEHFTAVLNRNKDAVKYVNLITDDRTRNS